MPEPVTTTVAATKLAPAVVSSAQSIASAAAPFLAAGASIWGGMRANRANAKMAQDQMKFQEAMSSTAVQRQQTDLIKAGLNPYMAGSGGSGASSPGGASATQSDVLGEGISTAMQAKMFREQLETARFAKRKAFHDAESAEADAKERRALASVYDNPEVRELLSRNLQAQLGFQYQDALTGVDRLKTDLESRRTQLRLMNLSLPAAQNEARMQQSPIGALLPFLSLLPGASGISSLLRAGTAELDSRRGVETTDSNGKSTFRARYRPK